MAHCEFARGETDFLVFARQEKTSLHSLLMCAHPIQGGYTDLATLYRDTHFEARPPETAPVFFLRQLSTSTYR